MAKIGSETSTPWRLARVAGTGLGAWLGGPVGAAVLGGGLSLAESIWSAKRADSAHQREVQDLTRAGLNPILSARGSGSEVGQQSDVGHGVSSGLAVQRQKAEIELLKAQAMSQRSSARQAETVSNEISTYAPGRGAEVSARTRVAEASADERQEYARQAKAVLEAEIKQRLSSAAGADAIRKLHELDFTRAENIQAFERSLGTASPTMRMVFEFLRVLAQYRAINPMYQ